MNDTPSHFSLSPQAMARLIALSAMAALAVAMGVGRFAFTPLLPLMIDDGLLAADSAAWLAAANYLGYFAGALAAARMAVPAAWLLAFGLLGTVAVTAAVGMTESFSLWVVFRFLAGLVSAWTLVATSVWGLGWLAMLARPHWAGFIFAGVGAGIAGVGGFCWYLADAQQAALALWQLLAGCALALACLPVLAALRFSVPGAPPGGTQVSGQAAPEQAAPALTGLIVAYTAFGFGYILPATYLPVMARRLVDDPAVFGLAWPLFGTAAALSTILAAWGGKRFSRLHIWACAQGAMGLGVLMPLLLDSLLGVSLAALLVGATFMVITMVAMQEARARCRGQASAGLARMTAGFASGQLMGPLVSAAAGYWLQDFDAALGWGLRLAACGLIASAVYLWQEARQPMLEKETR